MKDLRLLNDYRDKEWQREVMTSGIPKSKAGAFRIRLKSSGEVVSVIADNGIGDSEWEHVSVSTEYRCPTWNEMCEIKELFFDKNEVVMQLHPAEKDYVNFHDFCLHLWRPKTEKIPLPPAELVL